MVLKKNYLGKNSVDNMSSRVEDELKDTIYSRDKHGWNFEKYIKTHVDHHASVEHVYSGIDDWSKVQHLMAGIKTKVLDPVKTQIMASATLRNYFDTCVNIYKNFIEQSDNLGVRDENISSVHSDKIGAPSGSGGVGG